MNYCITKLCEELFFVEWKNVEYAMSKFVSGETSWYSYSTSGNLIIEEVWNINNFF